MLNSAREANRCIKILDNISLRGGFWPGACAAAIKDLQSALQKKFETDGSGTRDGNVSGRGEISQPLNPSDQARQPPPRQNGLARHPPSTFRQQLSSGSHISISNSQLRNSPNTTSPAQQMSLDPSANKLSNSETHLASPSYNSATFSHTWPGLDMGAFEMDDQFNGFDDIFQLIDVPFHLNEHGAQTTW